MKSGRASILKLYLPVLIFLELLLFMKKFATFFVYLKHYRSHHMYVGDRLPSLPNDSFRWISVWIAFIAALELKIDLVLSKVNLQFT